MSVTPRQNAYSALVRKKLFVKLRQIGKEEITWSGKTMSPVAIDLFAGAGGLAEGLEAAGIGIAVANELHPQAALTYAFNHPSTRVIVGDIRDISLDILSSRVEEVAGHRQVDLVVGGPPCQGFSTAGKKIINDPRNDLFRQFARVVEYFRPRMFMLENVPGFKKMYQGRAFAELSDLLSPLGYDLMDCVLDASCYGVPQRRQRFVMVGRMPEQTCPFSWPIPTYGDVVSSLNMRLFPETVEPFVTVSDALEDIAFLEPGWEANRYQSLAESEYARERRNSGGLLFNHLATLHRSKAVEMFSYIPEGGTISAVPAQLRTGKRTMARLSRTAISNAVLALPDDMIHYRHHRIPTVREMARLQSFDDDYVVFGKRTSGFVERRVDVPQYTQVGNAVPPLLAHALGIALMAALGGEICDMRRLDDRRVYHSFVRGSSGFAGYTLDPDAANFIRLESTSGEPIALPLSESDMKVNEATALTKWAASANPRRGQWSPGVKPRAVPTYVREAI